MPAVLLIFLQLAISCGENLRGQYNDPPGRLRTPRMAEQDLTVDELNTLITETNIILEESFRKQLRPKAYVCIPEEKWQIRAATARHLERGEKRYQWVALGPARSESEAYGGELKAEFDHIFHDIENTIEKANGLYARAMEVSARVKREPSRKLLHQVSFSLGLATVLAVRPLLAALEQAEKSPEGCSWKPFREHIQWMKNLVSTMDSDFLKPALQAMKQAGFQRSELLVYSLIHAVTVKNGEAGEQCAKLDRVDRSLRHIAHYWCGYLQLERNQPDLALEHFEDAKDGAQGLMATYIEEKMAFIKRKSPAIHVKKVR